MYILSTHLELVFYPRCASWACVCIVSIYVYPTYASSTCLCILHRHHELVYAFYICISYLRTLSLSMYLTCASWACLCILSTGLYTYPTYAPSTCLCILHRHHELVYAFYIRTAIYAPWVCRACLSAAWLASLPWNVVPSVRSAFCRHPSWPTVSPLKPEVPKWSV